MCIEGSFGTHGKAKSDIKSGLGAGFAPPTEKEL
jgi:hypothetical protein